MKKLSYLVAGARPNFRKIAPIIRVSIPSLNLGPEYRAPYRRGINTFVGNNVEAIVQESHRISGAQRKVCKRPTLGDDCATERIAHHLIAVL